MTLLSSSVVAGDHFRHGTYNDLRHDIIEGGEGVYAYNPVIIRIKIINPTVFITEGGVSIQNWDITHQRGQNAAGISAIGLRAGLNLPHGAIITEVKAYMYKLSGSQDLIVALYKVDPTDATWILMSQIVSSSTGNHSQIDTSITQPAIDNSAYTYALLCQLNRGGGAVDSVRIYAIKITYTITVPFP